MAWGYAKGFSIEYDSMRRKNTNCRDCRYYDSTDKSCIKRPVYFPEDGYGLWKSCKYFDAGEKSDDNNTAKQSIETEQNQRSNREIPKEINSEKKQSANNHPNSAKQKNKKVKSKQHQKAVKKEPSKEYLIDLKHFGCGDNVSKNIIRIGLEKDIDIVSSLDELCEIMNRDYRVNHELSEQLNTGVLGSPYIDKMMIYLSLVAEKLNVPISDFFIEDSEKDKALAYKILRDRPYYAWEEIELTREEYDSGDYFETYSIDEQPYIKGGKTSDYHKVLYDNLWNRKRYTIGRGRDSNGGYLYYLIYGDIYLRVDVTIKQYIMHGAVLWTEKEGMLADLVEKVIKEQVFIDE